jgi:hypothetical protein
MRARRWAAGALGLVLCCLLAGCRSEDTRSGDTRSRDARDWGAIAACLPAGLTLETEFCPDGHGCGPEQRTTVKRKLAELGARARGGKLYDSSGKEIAFYGVPNRGQPLPRKESSGRGRSWSSLSARTSW